MPANLLTCCPQQMDQRTEKIRLAQEKAEEMARDAEDFQAGASALVDKFKNQKWWQV